MSVHQAKVYTWHLCVDGWFWPRLTGMGVCAKANPDKEWAGNARLMARVVLIRTDMRLVRASMVWTETLEQPI